MTFQEELQWRGMLQDSTPGLEDYLAQPGCSGYIGFDPTAPSLGIGNYVQIMLLTLFQRAGHTPIALIGGATGRIGDPSGKDKERELKSYEEIEQNLRHQQSQIERLLSTADRPVTIVNNYDFYKDMNVLDFLRDVGKSITVNYMMAKESVKKRIETGISFTEFSYQLIQAYDFQSLYQQHNCKLQMGGSDQWGNITSGTEFIRRNLNGKAYALTTPLLTKADGSKFGKSESGNLWLDPEMTSPYAFYQFWINADDRDIPTYTRYFTLKSKEEVEGLEQLHQNDPITMKRLLAEEITERIHGTAALKSAQKVSQLLFHPKADANFVADLNANEWEMVSNEIPSFSLPRPNISNEGQDIMTLLSESSNILQSRGEVKRAIQNNAISINKVKVAQPDISITFSDFLLGKYMLVENGKKNKYLIQLIN